MADKQPIQHPDKNFTYGLFSAAVVCDGWIFVSGQGPLDMTTGKLVDGTIEQQTRLTLEHIEAILGEAGAGLDDIVRCTCYLADLADFEGFNRVYGEVLPEPRPARATVGAALMKNMKVEIEAIARMPQQG